MPPRRRTTDALKAVDGLVHTHLQQAPVDARVLANLAVAMVTEYSGAARGTLLLETGSGLAAQFALGPGLKAAALDSSSYDPKLVAEAERTRRLVRLSDRIAAPILMAGGVRGVIYLEAGVGRLDAEVEELATGVATRIATLIHSAVLLEDAARRAQNVETIEALGAFLAAGTLTDEHLDRTIEAALHSTLSNDAWLAITGESGEMLDLHVRGEDRSDLERLGREVAERLQAAGDDPAEPLGQPRMFEPLGADLLTIASGSAQNRPLGFLAVRRPGGLAYSEPERKVFRAINHLLAGAIGRLAYYRKAAKDALTGTGSRLALELAIVEALEHTNVSGLPLSILLVDIDRFKEINDTRGHLAGDAVLQAIAAIMRSRLRAADFVARFGGDEFLLLLPDTPAAEAARVAEELRELVAREALTEASIPITLSIGISAYPMHGKTPRELVRRADEALYAAKAGGRNRVAIASVSTST